MRRKLSLAEIGFMVAVAFFLAMALGGINIALWRHNDHDPWEAICWFNGIITSWAFPLVLCIAYCVIDDMHTAEEKEQQEKAERESRLAREAAVAEREHAHWEAMSHDERTHVLARRKSSSSSHYD